VTVDRHFWQTSATGRSGGLTIAEYLEGKLGKKEYGRLLDAMLKETRAVPRVRRK
jgi:hypothetical protein